MKLNWKQWLVYTVLLLLYGGAAYYFGHTAYLMGEAAYTIASGVSTGIIVSLPLSLLLLLFMTSFMTTFLRPMHLLSFSYILASVFVVVGWGFDLMNVFLTFLYLGGCFAHYFFVERNLRNHVKFNAFVVKHGQWFVKFAMIFILCAGVLFGGQRYVAENEVRIPEKELKQVSAFMSEQMPENPLGLTSNELSGQLEGMLMSIFDEFIKPQEQNLAWAIVFAVFIPLMIAIFPLGWFVYLLMFLIYLIGTRTNLLTKRIWQIDAEEVRLW